MDHLNALRGQYIDGFGKTTGNISDVKIDVSQWPLAIADERARLPARTWSAVGVEKKTHTHCGVMASQKCEGCHSLRLIS